MSATHLFAFPTVNAPTLIVLMIIGIMLFGKRLPEMGRTLAKGIREFQKGLSGIEDEVTAPLARDEVCASEAIRPQLPHRITEKTPRTVENDTNGFAPPPIS